MCICIHIVFLNPVDMLLAWVTTITKITQKKIKVEVVLNKRIMCKKAEAEACEVPVFN